MTPEPAVTASPVSTMRKIADSTVIGTISMLVQAPAVNFFNQGSAVAGRYNLSTIQAFRYIYQGNYHGGVANSFQNYLLGMAGHLTKEIPRVTFKAGGLYVYKPWLDTQLSKNYSNLAFATTLSAAEVIINPADTWRITSQVGGKLTYSFSALYAGALGNFCRQFGTWWGLGYSNDKLNSIMQKYTDIDPHSLTGVALKAYPNGFFFTTLVYGIERTKNELQFQAPPENNKLVGGRYFKAAQTIWNTQGPSGFTRGFFAKTCGNAVLSAGAIFLLELGKKNVEQNKEVEALSPSSRPT